MKKLLGTVLLLLVMVNMIGARALAQWNLDLEPVVTPSPKPKVTKAPTAAPTAAPTPQVVKNIEKMKGEFKTSCSTWLTSNGYRVDSTCVVDGKTKTAWNEGAKGSGIGEWIAIEAPNGPYTVAGFNIVNGYAKSSTVWKNNTRVEELTLYVDGVSVGTFFLEDHMDWQTIYFGEPVVGSEFIFEIESVYAGSKYKDACISEIELWGDERNAR